MEYGLSEFDFWNMTIAEIKRYVEAKKKIQEREAKEKAANDYVLADLIGRSISRIYSASAKMPQIGEVYPHLFDNEEIEEQRQQKKEELSILRFKQFAQSHNQKYKGKVNNKDERTVSN